jgi:hypothetical protein
MTTSRFGLIAGAGVFFAGMYFAWRVVRSAETDSLPEQKPPEEIDSPLSDVLPLYQVSNLGGGPAERVIVLTSWGEASLTDPLPAGGTAITKVVTQRAGWDKQLDGGNPKIFGFRYRDTVGVEHEDAAEGASENA